MGIDIYDDLIANYNKALDSNIADKNNREMFTRDTAFKLTNNNIIKKIPDQNCEDLKKYADFFGGVYQLGDFGFFPYVPKTQCNLNLMKLNPEICYETNIFQHLIKFLHKHNQWYLELSQYIWDEYRAKIPICLERSPPPRVVVVNGKELDEVEANKFYMDLTRTAMKRPASKRPASKIRGSNSQAMKRPASKRPASKIRGSILASKRPASKRPASNIRGGMRLRKTKLNFFKKF
jgi:hypothetical protein